MAWYRCGGTPSSVLSLPTPSEASGAIARFNTDLTENLLSAVAEFSASQASGTPTPSAPIPIVGVDKVNVTDCGKNLMNINAVAQYKYGSAEDLRYGILIDKAGTYTINSFNTESCYILVKTVYADGTYSDVARVQNGATSTISAKTVTIASGNKLLVYNGGNNNEETAKGFLQNVQIELGSFATAYEAYNGTTALINLGGTYYGGSVDAVTGKITKTWNYINLGDLEWFYNSTNGYFYNLTKIMPKSGTKNWLCTTRYLKPDSVAWSAMEDGMAGFGGIQFRVKDSSTTSSTQFKQNINGTYLAYELETPETEYASNTAEIPTIVGDNQVFADSGNIAVKFFETVGHKI